MVMFVLAGAGAAHGRGQEHDGRGTDEGGDKETQDSARICARQAHRSREQGQSVCLHVCLAVCLYVCLSMSLYMSARMSVCLYVHVCYIYIRLFQMRIVDKPKPRTNIKLR